MYIKVNNRLARGYATYSFIRPPSSAGYCGDQAVYGAGSPIERYLAEHGLRHYTEYHPDSRFVALQAIEAALFLGSAAVLLGLARWVVRRRTA